MINMEIIQVAYGKFKKSTITDLKPVEKELKLLEVKFSTEDLIVAYRLVNNSKSLKDALEQARKLTPVTYQQLLISAKKNVDDQQKEQNKTKVLQQQRDERKSEISQLAKTVSKDDKIYDYMVASAKTQNILVYEVNMAMKDGWVPFGGVSAAAFGVSPIAGNQYIQALVKYR